MVTYPSQNYPSITVLIPARNEVPDLQYILPLLPSIVTEVTLVDGHAQDDIISAAPALQHSQGKGKGGWRILKLILQRRKNKKPALALSIVRPQRIPEEAMLQ